MGQQQLLLIVLGVIIVGIAVVVGINLFNANAEESTKDTLVSEGTNLGAMAQQYYKKPTALGGGGNSFNGWDENDVPANLINTPSGQWDITSVDSVCTIEGTPLADLGYTWTITVVVTPTGINSTVVNP
jgi:hypothetical protein